MQLQGKKVIALGERDGVQGSAIAQCAASAGAEVVLEVTHCFVWTAAGALDLEGQEDIKRVAERYNADDMVVLLGTPNAESSRLYALTVTEGDPSWAGVLAGVELGLPVYHITEDAVKSQIASDAYEEHIALMEVVLEVDEIAKAVQDVRAGAGQQAWWRDRTMARDKRYWLMKSEPNVYAIADLKRDGSTCWDGVRNYQARNFMRDDMRVGDRVLFYHSNVKPMGIYGVAEVVSEAYADDTAFDPSDAHYDAKSDPANPTWMMVDIGYVGTFKEPITLDRLKQTPALEKMLVIQRGSRLSVQPVSREEWDIVMGLGELIT